MATFEVQRQILPIFDSPNQGARFYNPELPSSEPFVPGHRTCAGCGPSIQYRMTSKASGDNTILVGPTGCMYVANSSYLCTPYNVPWAHTQIGSAGSFTAGVAAAYEAMIRKGKWSGTFPNIICEAGDGSASDIGLASISGALYRNHDCLIICYDNEQYANTGIQASSRTPYGGMTTFSPPGPEVPEGKKLFPKDLARMMAAGHPHCYVATASVGYPIDLMNKVRKGLNHKGAAYLMIYTPCQKGFVYETPRSIDLGRIVVECGLYPIWEWNPEKREYDYSFRPKKHAALRQMQDGGRIIIIGSCVGERMMTPGLVAYAATKGAMKMFTQGLSREVGDRRITVNVIQPGPIDTDLNPASGDWAEPQIALTALKRYGSVEDIAAMVAFVASPEAAYITGASLTVDGGTNA